MTFRGTVSDVRIYNRALGFQEVAQSYRSCRLLYRESPLTTWLRNIGFFRMKQYERLWFWVKVTWRVLLGKETWRD